MLASFQRAFEGGLFAGGQAFEGLIQTVEHGFGAELVAHAFLGIDHFTVDFGGQVDVGVVALGGRAIHTHESAETLTQGFQTVVDVFVGALLKNTVLHISAVRQPLHDSATHGLCN